MLEEGDDLHLGEHAGRAQVTANKKHAEELTIYGIAARNQDEKLCRLKND